MEQLLQWAIKNSDQEGLHSDAEAVRRGEKAPDPRQFEPGLLDAILGKDDATRMKGKCSESHGMRRLSKAVQSLNDTEASVDDKETALDNLEMLVEQIDNASNMENMNLWPQVLKHLADENPAIRQGVAWVCGTAVQNNPRAQLDFLKHGGLTQIMDVLKNESDPTVRAKAQYALGGTISNCQPALKQFLDHDGVALLKSLLDRTEDLSTLRKVIFLCNNLMMQQPELAQTFNKLNLAQTLMELIRKHVDDDEDLVEKAIQTLFTLKKMCNLSLEDQDKKFLQGLHKDDRYKDALATSEWTLLV